MSGVGGTWLQLMCCATSRRRVPNFRDWRVGVDLVMKTEVGQGQQGGSKS